MIPFHSRLNLLLNEVFRFRWLIWLFLLCILNFLNRNDLFLVLMRYVLLSFYLSLYLYLIFCYIFHLIHCLIYPFLFLIFSFSHSIQHGSDLNFVFLLHFYFSHLILFYIIHYIFDTYVSTLHISLSYLKKLIL